MTKSLFLLLFCNICLGAISLRAQVITNGNFTNGYTGWTLVGPDPATATPDSSSPPLGFMDDALISSTSSAYEGDSTNGPDSATVSQLEAAFGNITLPGSPGSSTVVDGQAIYQTFTITAPAVLTFEYASSSEDYSSYDRVGYILQNVSDPMNSDFHGLSNSSSYGPSGDIDLTAGTYKLGFIAYNTGDNYSPTDIQVTDVDVSEAPEPGAWLLLACGCSLLGLLRRVAMKLIVSRL